MAAADAAALRRPGVGTRRPVLRRAATPARLADVLIWLVLLANVLFDFITWSFESRAPIVLLQDAWLAGVLVYFHRKADYIRVEFVLVALLAYLAILVPYSSDLVLTSNYFLKMALSSLFFPVGRQVFGTEGGFHRLLKVIPAIIVAFIGYTIAANLFGWGQTFYAGQAVRVGFIGVESQFQLAVAVILLPLLLRTIQGRAARVAIYILMAALVVYFLLTFRRTNLVVMALGLGALLVTGPSRRRLLLAFGLVVLVLWAASPWYWDFVQANLDIRKSRFESLSYYYKEEGRAVEMGMVIERISRSWAETLFGAGDLFNDAGKYGVFNYETGNLERQLHTDYARLLFGGGLVALSLYVTFFVMLFAEFFRAWRRALPGSPLHLYSAAGLTMVVTAVSVGFSSGVTSISYKTFTYVVLGSLLGVVKGLMGAVSPVPAARLAGPPRARGPVRIMPGPRGVSSPVA